MKLIHATFIYVSFFIGGIRAQVLVTEWIGTADCGFKTKTANIATVGKSSESYALSGGLLPSPFSNPRNLSPSSATSDISTSSRAAVPSSPTSSASRSAVSY